MRHIPDGVLRRLDDEPLAVPDRVSDHVADLWALQRSARRIAHDTERVAPAVLRTAARTRHRYRLGAASARVAAGHGGWSRRAPPATPVSGDACAVAESVAAGRAGHRRGRDRDRGHGCGGHADHDLRADPRGPGGPLSQSDLRAIAAFTGLGDSQALGGFSAPNGSTHASVRNHHMVFGPAHPASSLAQATAEAGFPVSLPAHLPAGVGAVQRFVVQPRVSATVTFNSTAAASRGSSVTLDAGPAVFAEYAGASGTGVPTLGVATMRRPTAQLHRCEP